MSEKRNLYEINFYLNVLCLACDVFFFFHRDICVFQDEMNKYINKK